VHAEAEGDVVAGVAVDVEPVGSGKDSPSGLPMSLAMTSPSPARITWPAISMSASGTRRRPLCVIVR
jgi:hypothetical protein